MIYGRQPIFWIGLGVTIVLNLVATLLGVGLISDVTAGRLNDGVKALGELLVAISPLIAVIFQHGTVTPVAAPVLELGTPVTTPTGQPAIVNGVAPSSVAS